jgi:hypothetical protein
MSRIGDERLDGLVVEACSAGGLEPTHQTALQRRLVFGHAGQRTTNEGAASGLAFDEPLGLKLAVGPVHGVGVDGDLLDHVAHCRKLIARAQDAQPERLADLVNDLAVDGETGVSVQPKLDQRLVLHTF